ncbi:MAG: 6-phosphogluconolactonase [Fusicatenibacter sp.]|nr:6-phosphogluconolactonase [Fusicatenibacter sp.]
MSLIREFQADALSVAIYDTEAAMGQAAAADAAREILRLQETKEEINIIFAAAVSQNELLDALYEYKEIDWGKINAFHMDEYVGVAEGDSRSLSGFLCSHFLDQVSVKNRFFLNGMCEDVEAECDRYGQLLEQYPCDLVFLGIGDNGHLAFNDPHVADFRDSQNVKTVAIDDISKQQQVNAGNFPDMESVPSLAFTVTIPALLRSKKMICVVPTAYKAKAAYDAVRGPVSETCPASVLRGYSNAKLYLDRESAKYLL